MSEIAVTVVLDRVVGAAQEHSGHFGPGVVVLHSHSLHDVEDPAFLRAPGRVPQQWVQLIDPPFTALFAAAPRYVPRDELPLARSIV